MEKVEWDGVVTCGDDGGPVAFSSSYGSFTESDSSMSVHTDSFLEEILPEDYEIFVNPPFNSVLILMYNIDGRVNNVQWDD